MAKAQSLKIIGSIIVAMLVSQLALSADLTLGLSKNSLAPKTLPDLKKAPLLDQKLILQELKNFKLDSKLSNELSKNPKLKMNFGGSDSGGGGGQGVYDLRTGQVHFVDILSREDLQRMQLATNPQQQVFARFPKCTKTPSWNLPDKYRMESVDGPENIFEELSPFLGFFGQEFASIAHASLWRLMTSRHLSQLKDATSIAPEYQMQLAIYRNGITYFQQQALALMPFEEFKWLMVKESLRAIATYQRLRVSNAEIEEILRLMYKKNGPAVVATTYFLKAIRPNFEMDTYTVLLGKKDLIQRRLENADLSRDERELWKGDLVDIQFKESKDFNESLVPERLRLDRSKMNFANRPEDDGTVELEQSVDQGIIPSWTVMSGEIQKNFENCSK